MPDVQGVIIMKSKHPFGKPPYTNIEREPDTLYPVSREMLIYWVATFKPQNKEDASGILDFQTQITWRLKDEGLFRYTPKVDYEKLWKELKNTIDGITSGEIPIGNHGELSQLLSIRALMENM
jgi:hypothetical protein